MREIRARYGNSVCKLCNQYIDIGSHLGQWMTPIGIRWVHLECIPDLSAPTKGWNGTPSEKPNDWRRKPRPRA